MGNPKLNWASLNEVLEMIDQLYLIEIFVSRHTKMSQPFDPERIFLGIYSKVLIIKRGKALLAILFAILLCIILKIRNNVNNQERQ